MSRPEGVEVSIDAVALNRGALNLGALNRGAVVPVEVDGVEYVVWRGGGGRVGGAARAGGALAALVDVIGGGLAARVAQPDWIATADLTLHLTGTATAGAVEARGRVAHAGRTTVVIEVGLFDDPGPAATGGEVEI